MLKKLTILSLSLCCLALTACLKNEYNSQGYIEGRFTYVSSQNTGTLNALQVERGTQVKLNQPIFKLDPNPELSHMNQIKSDLAQAQSNLADLLKGKRPSELQAIVDQQKQVTAQLIYAKKMLYRYQTIYMKGLLDKATVDQAQSNYNDLKAQLSQLKENLVTANLAARSDQIAAAQAAVQAQQAALKQAQWELQQKMIVAPIAGFVYDTYYREGETVPSNHPVLSIIAPENIYAVFYIAEKDFSTVRYGQPVKITCDACPPSITATVSYISPEAEYTPPIIYSENSRSKLVYRIEARIPVNIASQFHPGQPITVTYENGKQPNG